mgnify:CR=1 FL=1
MKIDRTELIRLKFSALDDFWEHGNNDAIVSPCATIEEWKNLHESLSKVIVQGVSNGVVVVDGNEEEVVFEQREDNGKTFIEFNGDSPYSQWTFVLERSDAQKFLDYIGEMLK